MLGKLDITKIQIEKLKKEVESDFAIAKLYEDKKEQVNRLRAEAEKKDLMQKELLQEQTKKEKADEAFRQLELLIAEERATNQERENSLRQKYDSLQAQNAAVGWSKCTRALFMFARANETNRERAAAN